MWPSREERQAARSRPTGNGGGCPLAHRPKTGGPTRRRSGAQSYCAWPRYSGGISGTSSFCVVDVNMRAGLRHALRRRACRATGLWREPVRGASRSMARGLVREPTHDALPPAAEQHLASARGARARGLVREPTHDALPDAPERQLASARGARARCHAQKTNSRRAESVGCHAPRGILTLLPQPPPPSRRKMLFHPRPNST